MTDNNNEARIAAVAEQVSGKTLAICLPGKNYSGRFMMSLIDLGNFCARSLGLNIMYSQQYSPVVADCRMKVLGGRNDGGRFQRPFDGPLYDWVLWIDSDMAFTREHLLDLLEMNEDIASGWYMQPGGLSTLVERIDHVEYCANGAYPFMSKEKIESQRGPFAVDYAGMGWMLVRAGVYEAIEMPWFEMPAQWLDYNGREYIVPVSEDVAFCLKAKVAGFRVMINPLTRPGHEKLMVI